MSEKNDDSDGGLFRQQVGEVTPLKKTNKVERSGSTALAESAARVRRKAAEGDAGTGPASGRDTGQSNSYVSDDYVELLKPGDYLEYKKPGVQDGVYKKLRLGKYRIDGRLDLHRKTVAQARTEVFDFVAQALAYDFRTLLILHGKGERNVERPGVLKSYVAKWLLEMPEVLAFHTAQQKHGGLGAVYVLLRKSEKLKEKTREEHSGKR